MDVFPDPLGPQTTIKVGFFNLESVFLLELFEMKLNRFFNVFSSYSLLNDRFLSNFLHDQSKFLKRRLFTAVSEIDLHIKLIYAIIRKIIACLTGWIIQVCMVFLLPAVLKSNPKFLPHCDAIHSDHDRNTRSDSRKSQIQNFFLPYREDRGG